VWPPASPFLFPSRLIGEAFFFTVDPFFPHSVTSYFTRYYCPSSLPGDSDDGIPPPNASSPPSLDFPSRILNWYFWSIFIWADEVDDFFVFPSPSRVFDSSFFFFLLIADRDSSHAHLWVECTTHNDPQHT